LFGAGFPAIRQGQPFYLAISRGLGENGLIIFESITAGEGQW
jgi:hypothetical protein